MILAISVVQLLSVCCVLVRSIHVPGENVDKKTLNTLGIKTLGWQSSENANDGSNVNIHHNYSKVSLQNENVDAHAQYSQPPTNYRKPQDVVSDQKHEEGVKGSRVLPTFGQEKDTELDTNTFSQTSMNTNHDDRFISQKQDDLINQDSWNGQSNSGQIYDQHNLNGDDTRNKYVLKPLQKNAVYDVPSLSSNDLKQSSQNNLPDQKQIHNAHSYGNTLELDEIIKAEKQYQAQQELYNVDQMPEGSNYAYDTIPYTYSDSKREHTSAFKFTQDTKVSQQKNNRILENTGVPYSKCPPLSTGQFIYQSTCHQFLNCWKGRGYVQNCAPGNLFNPQTLECDFASKVHCLTDSGSLYSDEYKSISSASARTISLQCPPEYSGVIPHGSYCSKFINCANGVAHVMDCPPGTLFSLKINSCDFPYNAECAGWTEEFGGNIPQGSDIYQVNGGNRLDNEHSSYSSTKKTYGGSANIASSPSSSNNGQWSTGNTLEENQNGYYQTSNVYTQQGHLKNQNQNTFYTSGSDVNRDQHRDTNTHSASTSNQNVYYTGPGSDFHQNQNTETGYYNGEGIHGQHSYYDNKVTHGQGQEHAIVNESVQKVVYGLQQGVDHTPRCPQGASGLFPHPTVCAKFLNCANGQVFIQDCGPGTVFNPQTQVCDFPYNVECSDYRNLIDVRSQPKIPHGDSSTQGSYIHSRDPYENSNGLEGSSSNVHGQYIHGDHETGGNGYPDKTNTKGQKSPIADNNVEVTCPTYAVGFYPHPTICAKYFTCTNGKPTIYKCATGTVFNPTSRVCDVPQRAKCSAGTNQNDYSEQQNNKEKFGQSGSSTNIYHQNQNSATQKPNQGSTDSQQGSYNQQSQGASEHSQTGANKGTYNQNSQGQFEQTQDNNNQGPFKQKTNNGHYNQNDRDLYEHNQGYYHQNTNQGPYVLNQGANGQRPDIQNNKYPGNTGKNPYTQNNQGSYNQNNQGSFEHNQGSNNQGPYYQGSYNQNSEGTSEHTQGGSNNNNLIPKIDNGKGAHGGQIEFGSKFKDVCSKQDFYCSSTICIPKEMACDGSKDCPDGNDEENCGTFLDQFVMKQKSVLAIREKERYPNRSLAECAKSCVESKDFQCKSFSYRSDAECFLSDSNIGMCGALLEAEPYNYYEMAAYTVDCTDLYKCPNNKCINNTQICDGINDCGDRSDEKNCTPESFGYEIRLAGGKNKNEGRIEMKAFGNWGYVCDDRFGMRDADVVCRELGFPLGAVEVKGNSYFAKEVELNNVLYLMDDVVCLGNETSIKDCDFNGWGVSNCEPQEIVGVVCKTPVEKCPKDQWKCDSVQECVPWAFVCDNVFDCTDRSDEANHYCESPAEIRLANGKSDREGRIEIRYHGIWGTVCDDDFNDDAAKVVCNTLGYPGKATAKKDGVFGEGEGPIWLDQVFCQGNETLLQECSHWNWGEHNCEHSEDVGVVCSGKAIVPGPAEVETERKSNTEAPLNIIEVPPQELLPSQCGLRKDAIFNENDDVHFRVVQGSVAKKGFYPWQASLRIRNSAKPTHWCGAIVISRTFVLTAAHCLVGFSKGSYVVIAGDYNTDEEEGTEQEIHIEEFYIHEEFRSGQKMNNDIALVKLKGSGFMFTKDIQPICLPDSDLPYVNQLNCTISGFGSVQTGKSGYSHDLRAGWVPLQSPEVCTMPHVYGSSITDGMFCAGLLDEGVDACEGDSGGPLACLHEGVFTLYGITSWGQHCGHANKPGVYVKVSHYRNWIEKTMQKNLM